MKDDKVEDQKFDNFNEYEDKLKAANEQNNKKLQKECQEHFANLLEHVSNLKSIKKVFEVLEKCEKYIKECGVFFNEDLSKFMINMYSKISKSTYIDRDISMKKYVIEFTIFSWFMQFSKEPGFIISNYIEVYNYILQKIVVNNENILDSIYFFNLGIQMTRTIKKNNTCLIGFFNLLSDYIFDLFSKQDFITEVYEKIKDYNCSDLSNENKNYLELSLTSENIDSSNSSIKVNKINKDKRDNSFSIPKMLIIWYYYLKSSHFLMNCYVNDINFDLTFLYTLKKINSYKGFMNNCLPINVLIEKILSEGSRNCARCLKAKKIPINLIKNTMKQIPSLEPNTYDEVNNLENVNKSMLKKMKKSEKQVIRQIKKKTIAISEEKKEKEKIVREKRKAEQKFLNQFAEQARNEHQKNVTSQNKKRHKLKKHNK